jgi:hypothetical protein
VIEQNPTERFAEHASWLCGADLERLLGGALHRFAYLVEAAPRGPEQRARAAVRLRGEDIVALVDEQQRFRDMVVDRREVVEALAEEAVTADASQPSPP